MKLHLPKSLFVAVLAATVASTVWAENSTTTTNSGWGILAGGQGEATPNSYYIGDAIVSSINTADTSVSGNLFLRSNEGLASATVTNLSIKSGDTLKVDGWYDENADHPEFSLLTISNLAFGAGAKLAVESGNTVQINKYTGNMSGTVNGTLQLNTSGDVRLVYGTDSIDGSGTIELAGGSLTLNGHGDGGQAVVRSHIKVGAGTTLKLDGGDALGWHESSSTKSITLKGTGTADNQLAKMIMLGTDVDTTGRQTLRTHINLEGYSLITGGSLQSLGGKITASGTNNKIESHLYIRKDLTIEVTGANDTLVMSGGISWRNDDKGKVTKSGAGTLTLNGTNVFENGDDNSFWVTNGKTIITGDTTVKGGLGMRNGASLEFDAGTHSIKKIDIHNGADSTTETLLISGATVNVTGGDEVNKMNGEYSGPAAVVVGHWHHGTGKITVGGEDKESVFNVLNGTIRMSYNSSSELTIGQKGTVNAQGIQYSNFNDGTGTDNAIINLSGGRLNLGTGGISCNTSKTGLSGKREFNLLSGTLGALSSSVNIDGTQDAAKLAITVSGNVTIDTDIVNESGVATGDSSTITFSDLVTTTNTSALSIKGAGSVQFLGGLNLGNSINLESGSLVLGGTVDISSLTTISSVSYDDETRNGFQTISYTAQLVTGTGVASVTTANDVAWKSGNDFVQGTFANGVLTLADIRGSSYYVSTGSINRAELVADSTSGVTATTAFVLNGGTLQLSANEGMNGSLISVSESGASSTILLAATSTLQNATAHIDKVAGTGTIEITTGGYGSTFSVNEKIFSGTTRITSGNFEINDVKFGNKLQLANGVNFQLKGSSEYTFAADKELILEGKTEIHQNTNATLDFNGKVSGANGTYDRRGGGTLTFNNEVSLYKFVTEVDARSVFMKKTTLNTMNAKKGDIDIYSNEVSINVLDTSLNNQADATVTLKEKAEVTVNSQIWGGNNASILLEKDAILRTGSVSITGLDNTLKGKLQNTGSVSDAKDLYSTENEEFTISNAKVTIDSSTEAEVFLGNKLENSSLVNAGTAVVTATNSGNAITKVDAAKAGINLHNVALHNLTELKIGEALAVSATDSQSNTATIAVQGSASFGKGAILNANLEIKTGSSVELDGALTLGNSSNVAPAAATTETVYTLSLEKGLTLQGNILEQFDASAPGSGEVILFSGVDTLKLGGVDYNALTDVVKLSDYFRNDRGINFEDYYIGFKANGDVYAGLIVPEPATATLSLLALAGLCARRRRASR